MADQTAADDDGASAPSRAVSSTVGDSEASGPEQLVGDQVMAEQQQPMAGAAAGGSPDERAGMCECFLFLTGTYASTNRDQPSAQVQ